MLSNDLDRIGAGHAQYTLLLDERGCPIDDLIAYRFADDHLLLVVNASRVDDDRDWLERAPARATSSWTTAPTEIAMLALQGPTALGLVELPRADAVRLRRGRGLRGARARCPHRLHRRARRRADVSRPSGAGELWDALVAAGASPAGWVRATRCGSRCAIRSTATTCDESAPRSSPAWAGCARSTPRTSWVPTRCARRARRACPTGWWPSRIERAAASPARACRAARGRGHQRHDVAVAGVGIGMALRARPPAARPGTRARDRRPRPRRWPRRFPASRCTSRRRAHERGELPRRAALPRGARLGAGRRRRRHLRHHLVRAGHASARSCSTPAGGRRPRSSEGRRLRRAGVDQGRVRR